MASAIKARFPSGVDVKGKAAAGVTGEFEVVMDGTVLHSKLGGDGFVDSEPKMTALLSKIAAQCAKAGHSVTVDDKADVSGYTSDFESLLRNVLLMAVGYLFVKFGLGW